MGVLGEDFICMTDFDGFFGTTSDDAVLVRQYVYHKLISGPLLDSESTDGWIDWGCNVIQYCGQGFDDEAIAALGPTIAIKLADDPDGPLAAAEVISRRYTLGPAFEMAFAITVETAIGPLRLVAEIGIAGVRLQE